MQNTKKRIHSSTSLILWLYRPIRIIRMQGVLSSVYWTIRSWLWNYPTTPDFGLWDEGDPSDGQAWTNQRKRILHTWHFLHPFFASHGYSSYVPKDPKDCFSPLIPSTKHGIETVETMPFPFAQYCCQGDNQVEFNLIVSAIVSIHIRNEI